MRSAVIMPLVILLSASIASAADREFKDVVRALSEEFHTKPMHIPLMGLVNGFMKIAHPVGAKHVELAIFQDVDWDKGSSGDPVTSIRRAIGSWQPFVTTRDRQGQTVMVYMRENGKDINLLLTTVERDQLVVTEVRVDPKRLMDFINSPDVAAWKWSGIDQHNEN